MNSNSNNAILIIEDSDEDFYIIQRAFKETDFANLLFRCEDGDEAIDFLFRKGRYSDKDSSPFPDSYIILLDLNLPGTDGREVLETIKADSELTKIPVIVLTTSDVADDIDRCYAAGANSYIHKPLNMKVFFEALKRLQEYWFEIVLLPKI